MYFCSGLSSYMLLLLFLGLVSPPNPNADESNDRLSDVTFEDNVYSQEDDEESRYQEFGLCIPQDRLEDVDFSPRFDDDYIRLPYFEFEFDSQDYNKEKQEYSTTTQNLAKQDSATRDYAKVVVDVDDDDDGGEVEDIRSNNVTHSQRAKDDERCTKTVKHNSRGKPLSLEQYCDYPEDVRRKPRTEKSKENRKRAFEVIRRGGVGKKRTFEVIPLGVGKKRTPVEYLDSLSRSSSLSRERKRICTHCEAEDTPQWRLGPSGPNTLCNACGLRYKVGRLVHNYRPAASPSFNSAEHSNFYKRLVRKKIKVDD